MSTNVDVVSSLAHDFNARSSRTLKFLLVEKKPGFAAGLFRLALRRALGERGCLTLAGVLFLVEALFQRGDALGEFVDDAITLNAPRA